MNVQQTLELIRALVECLCAYQYPAPARITILKMSVESAIRNITRTLKREKRLDS